MSDAASSFELLDFEWILSKVFEDVSIPLSFFSGVEAICFEANPDSSSQSLILYARASNRVFLVACNGEV